MTTALTNQTRHSASSTNQGKHSTTLTGARRSGGPVTYNQAGFTYNQALDPVLGLPVYYNTVGLPLAITNQVKH